MKIQNELQTHLLEMFPDVNNDDDDDDGDDDDDDVTIYISICFAVNFMKRMPS